MVSVDEIISKAKHENRKVLTEFESKTLLNSIGFPIPEQKLVSEEEGLDAVINAVEKIGYPVVMKLMAEDVVHKSDVGAVKLNLTNKEAIKDAYNELLNIESKSKKSISIQKMEKAPIAEIIMGSLQDAQFGPTIMFGIGGVLVELMKDVSFRISPISDFDADEMIHEIKGFQLLDGYRGKPKADLEAIKQSLIKIADLAFQYQSILEMDLNPVFVYETGLKCVDARIILK
jgi:acetate---CoA ligase (ADP-forming) subunit beta